ncbi:pentatricopeptide repeat-containing protein At1g02370, mitochondrial-like isoform X2 [Asparagus officinalis]|nr:pentatricopeptide repeat-containing protein At1g02370, mitochondrial-like isoform X2 [Asparagus officinalis]XP_020274757.1 pentatricopeptide repeat-containing protein At1g02370, mitochondrial-like isoform X2 [Asparagus officinalis]
MEKKGLTFNFSSHAIRLDLISKVSGIDMAEKYFGTLPIQAKNQKTYGSLLNSFCQEKMEDKAIALFEKLKELNFASTLAYNNIMTLYKILDQPKKALMYFEEMKGANVASDTFTLGILITCYTSLNDIESVERVIEEMKVAEIPMTEVIYSNLASCYICAGIYEKAELALKKAEEIMNHRDRTSYNRIISLYARAGNLAETIRVWKLLKASFPRTNNLSYHNFLHALGILGDVDGVKQCFEEWESVCINYDVKVLNVVIDAYLRKGMVEEAESLREKGIEKGLGLDFRTLDLFTDYYLERNDVGLALKCLDIIDTSEKQCEWKPSKEKVSIFLKYFEEAKDVDGAEKFCQILKKINCLDAEAYESLIRVYVAAERKEPSLPQRIKEDGIKVSAEAGKLLEMVTD